MFRKVLALIVGLSHGLDLNMDSESIRKAVLTGLDALAKAAALTPGIWDDLAVKAAAAFVASPAWDMILKFVLDRVGQDAPMATADEAALAEAFAEMPA